MRFRLHFSFIGLMKKQCGTELGKVSGGLGL